MSLIYDNRVIVFDASVANGAKIVEECDMTGTNIDIYDSAIVIKFWPCWQMKGNKRGIDDAFKKVKKILKKYNVEYKVKKF